MNPRTERINELARKKRETGLTEGELKEQQELRAAYLRDFRKGMEQMLESIVVEEVGGQRHPLKKRPPE